MRDSAQINEILAAIKLAKPFYENQWPGDFQCQPEEFGLVSKGGRLAWSQKPDWLDGDLIKTLLKQGARQLQINIHQCIESTNTHLLAQAQSQSIANQVHLAETQSQGRGRRGRSWLSPYARNLAISLGVDSGRKINDLGGLSLVVGMALAEALENLGVEGIALKWPNDVWVNEHKLAGVLVELMSSPNGSRIVVGFGVNVSLNKQEMDAIDQPVTDLRHNGVFETRSIIASSCINSVSKFLDYFETNGFQSFVPAFNKLHALHEKECVLVNGANVPNKAVKVIGVGPIGQLIVESKEGVEQLHGGEISIRPK
jgi:BirA family biotin operon repressor/biotin-[acetyl-CoA-carboxylase] ligase